MIELLADAPSLDYSAISLAGANMIGLGLIAWLVKHWQTVTFPAMAKDHREQVELMADATRAAATEMMVQFKGELMHQRNARAGEIERFLQEGTNERAQFLTELKEERVANRENNQAMQAVLRELTKEINSLPERLGKVVA